MPPIEVGSTRAIGAVNADIARKAGSTIGSPATRGASAPTSAAVSRSPLAASEALDPGEAPVDTDRVSQIRKAVESGTYPLNPARITDAMIAAGMLLRTSKS
jgi:negative regulator of flagellin synthesis FlgM